MAGFFDLNDPQSALPLLGLLQGLGQAAAPSRLPVPLGEVLGSAAGGYVQGKGQALDYMKNQLALKQAQNDYNFNARLYGPYYAPLSKSEQAAVDGTGGETSPDATGPAVGGPPPATPVTPPSGVSYSAYASKANQLENSTGNPAATNPNSTAAGNGQFIDSTWLSVLRKAHPELANVPDDQILALRTDPKAGPVLAQEATAQYAQQNAPILKDAGIPVTTATVFAAHRLGPHDAVKVLKADPNTPLVSVLSPAVIKANPQYANMTCGQFAANLKMHIGNAPLTDAAAADQNAPPAQQPPSGMPPSNQAPMGGMDLNTLRGLAIGQKVGMTRPDILTDEYWLHQFPPGSEEYNAMAMKLRKDQGYDNTVTPRANAPVLERDPVSGQLKLGAFVPAPQPGYTYKNGVLTQLNPGDSVVDTGAPSAASPPAPVAPAASPVAPAPQASAPVATKPPVFGGNTPVQNSVANIPTKLPDFEASLGPTYKPPLTPNPYEIEHNPQLKEFLEKRAANSAETLAGYQNQAVQGQRVYTNLEQMYQVLQRGLNTGPSAPAAMELATLAHQAHLDDLIPKGFDGSDANVFNKVATQLVFAQLKQIGGRPLVTEITGLQKANPGLTLTPEANTEILDSVLADQRWVDARYNLADQYAQKYGTLSGFDANFNSKYPAVDTYNNIAARVAAMGYKLPGQNQPATATHNAQSAVQIPQGMMLPKGVRLTGRTATGPMGIKLYEGTDKRLYRPDGRVVQ